MEQKVKVTPMNGRYAVRRDDIVLKTNAGILLQPGHVKKPGRGTVVFVPEPNDVPEISVGKRIVFDPIWGTDVVVNDEKLTLIHPDNIYVVYEPGHDEALRSAGASAGGVL